MRFPWNRKIKPSEVVCYPEKVWLRVWTTNGDKLENYTIHSDVKQEFAEALDWLENDDTPTFRISNVVYVRAHIVKMQTFIEPEKKGD